MSGVVLRRLRAVTDRPGWQGCLSCLIVYNLSNRATSLALVVLGVITGLASVSAIGAVTTLIVIAT